MFAGLISVTIFMDLLYAFHRPLLGTVSTVSTRESELSKSKQLCSKIVGLQLATLPMLLKCQKSRSRQFQKIFHAVVVLHPFGGKNHQLY